MWLFITQAIRYGTKRATGRNGAKNTPTLLSSENGVFVFTQNLIFLPQDECFSTSPLNRRVFGIIFFNGLIARIRVQIINLVSCLYHLFRQKKYLVYFLTSR